MSFDFRPLSELDAVNFLLSGIHEQPVSTIIESKVGAALLARNTLHRYNRMVQEKGLHCNTEKDITLYPNTDNNILVPNNTLVFDATYPTDDLVLRGSKVYNLTDHTFTFTSSIQADLVFFLPYDELPAHVRTYVAVVAAQKFHMEVLNENADANYLREEALLSRRDFRRNELRAADVNLNRNNPFLRAGLRRF